MLDWYDRHVRQLIERAHFALIRRLHPELGRLRDESERRWTLFFTVDETPGWKRVFALSGLFVAGPMVIVLGAFVIASSVTRLSPAKGLLLFVAGWCAGFVLTGFVFEMFRRGRVRRRSFMAMRIFGHDVCPFCGYDMAGHPVASGGEEADVPPRICPECGANVPELKRAA